MTDPTRGSPLSPGALERASRLFDLAAEPAPAAPVASPAAASDTRPRVGKFILDREVGAGAGGVVWRALDPVLERTVALKLLRPELRAREDVRRRFLGEFRTLARIQHPNVVLVHEVGEHEGVPFAAMEWLDGHVPAGPLPLARALEVGLAVARALEAVHRAGVVHSDVKPANLLVGEGTVKLADFGVSGDLLGVPAASGTPAFMAPEQAAGVSSEIDHRTDLYNLGATILSLLTGRPPHASLEAARTGRLEVPSSLPRPVRALLERATAPARADRYPSAEAMRRAIEAALVPGSWARRRSALGLALVLLAAGVVGLALRARGPGLAERRERVASLLAEASRARFPQEIARRRQLLAVAEAEALELDRLAPGSGGELLAAVVSRGELREPFRAIPFDKRTLAPLAQAALRLGARDPALRLFTDKDGEVERAIALLEQGPPTSDRCFLRAFGRHYTGDPARAVADYERAAELDPWWPELWIYEGWARISAGEAERAVACADLALALGGRDQDARALRGAARVAAGDWSAAAADLAPVHSADPARLDVTHDLALAEVGLGHLARARALLEHVEEDPAVLYARVLAHPDEPPAEHLARLLEAARVAADYKDVSSPDRETPAERDGHRPFRVWSLSYERVAAEVDLKPMRSLPQFRKLRTALRDE